MRCAAAVMVVMGVGLAGCLSRAEPEEAMPALDAAEAMLMQAALSAETALTRLSKLEGNPAGGGEIPRIVPEGLLKRVDFQWVGPVDEAARRLAEEAGYRFETAGAAPLKPVMVEVRSEGRPLIMLFRDLGVQAGNAAALMVDAERTLVVLDWTGGGK